MARAEQDLVFVPQLLSESQQILQQHFQDFVRAELARRGITFGDHPLLLPFIETHGRELADFVLTSLALHHRFRLTQIETLAGDPARLLRLDLWNTLQAHIDHAERHFLSGVGGLPRILQAVEEARSLRVDRPRDGQAGP
jgi:hypothetical protein